MKLTRLAPALSLALLLTGCGSEPRPERSPFSAGMEASTGDEAAAFAAITALEQELAAAALRTGEDRVDAERRLGRRVEATVATCTGTRHENKALYLLASWRFQFDPDLNRTLEALDRLDRTGSPVLKQAGRSLRIQALCRQGRLAAARPLAVTLVQDIPQFQPVLDLVTLHERVGTAAPDLPGLSRPAQPVLLTIAATADAMTLHRLNQWLQRPAAQAWVPVVIVLDAAPAEMAALPGTIGRPDAVAYHPRTADEVTAWRQAWRPPSEFLTAALGADGTLLAVDLRVDDPLPTLPAKP